MDATRAGRSLSPARLTERLVDMQFAFLFNGIENQVTFYWIQILLYVLYIFYREYTMQISRDFLVKSGVADPDPFHFRLPDQFQ